MRQENNDQPITIFDAFKNFCRTDTIDSVKKSLMDLLVGYLISDISNDQSDRRLKVFHFEAIVALLDDIEQLQIQKKQADA